MLQLPFLTGLVGQALIFNGCLVLVVLIKNVSCSFVTEKISALFCYFVNIWSVFSITALMAGHGSVIENMAGSGFVIE